MACARARRLNVPLVLPLVDHHNTGTRHAVSPEGFNVPGVKTACGLVVEDVPKDGTPHDVDCDNCARSIANDEHLAETIRQELIDG